MIRTAYFSGGRFEGLIDIFKDKPGIIDITGGTCQTKDGNKVAVQVEYEPNTTSDEKILDYYLKNIDLKDEDGQFSDRGLNYQSVIYYQNEMDLVNVTNELKDVRALVGDVFVKVMPFMSFEADSLDSRCETDICMKKHHSKVKLEKRYQVIANIWQHTYEDKIKKLSPLSFEVTKKNHTERPYTSDYVTNTKKGIYVDIISNEPLFSSNDQFDAGCGWPSFSKPITTLLEKTDVTYGMQRIEIRSIHSDAHLGHVFDDGPKELGGLRYCINGASLKFIAYNDLEKEGFKAYKALFK